MRYAIGQVLVHTSGRQWCIYDIVAHTNKHRYAHIVALDAGKGAAGLDPLVWWRKVNRGIRTDLLRKHGYKLVN